MTANATERGKADNLMDQQRIERLARLESKEGIVSLCLRFEPRLLYERGLAMTKLKSAFDRFERREPSEEGKRAARRERPRIEAFLRDWTPSGRALVIFSCEPAGIWEAIPLETPLPAFMTVDTTTNSRPLTMLIDEFPRLLMCVVQRDKATLFVSEQRRGAEAGSFASDVPGQHRTGGWSQARFERHTDVHVENHLREVVSALEAIDAEEPFDRLILGGTSEVTRETERLLPERLRSRLVASIKIDVKHDSEEDILEKARVASEKAERREEEELVQTMADRAEAGGRGVTGLDDTLRAVGEGRVETLVVAENLAERGRECKACDYLGVADLERCPVCGGETEAAPNIVDVAIERAFLNGAEIDFVFEGPASKQLSECGGIGALLRF